MNRLEIAKLFQFNAKAEAQAILDYTDLINEVEQSNLDEFDKKYIIENVSELISDELNHAKKLNEMYTGLTDIETAKS